MLRNGKNMAKVREESPQDTSIQGTWQRKFHQLGGQETGPPSKGRRQSAPPELVERTHGKEETKPKDRIW